MILVCPRPFTVEEEFALFYRKFFEAPGAAGFEACPIEREREKEKEVLRFKNCNAFGEMAGWMKI